MEVEVCRNGILESRHQIEAYVVQADGNVLFSTGKDFSFFPRSAVKPLQAQLLIESGAFEKFNLTSAQLALAGASHSGEAIHTEPVHQWLKSLNLDHNHLQCGAHWPEEPDEIAKLGEKHQKPSALHNNCSGKHAGLLNVCVHQKLPVENYHQIDHPLQQQLKKLMEQRLDQSLIEYGIDGCSIPTFMTSFQGCGKAFANMAKAVKDNSHAPSKMVFDAFQKHPVLTAGSEDYCSQVMMKNSGKLLVKIGAEGVMAAISPEKQMAIVIKAWDGAYRAAEVAVDHLIQKFFELQPARDPVIKNWAGREVGSFRVKL